MADPFESQLQAMFDEAPAAFDAAAFTRRVEAELKNRRRRQMAGLVALAVVGMAVSLALLAGPAAGWAGTVDAWLGRHGGGWVVSPYELAIMAILALATGCAARRV